MSHFPVLVIGPDYEAQLQPYHEYECTGTNDQYVQEMDITDRVKEEFNKPQKVLRLADGQVFDRYDNRFYTAESTDKMDRLMGGRQEFVMPAGAVELEMTAEEARAHGVGYPNLDACAKDYFGCDLKIEGRYYDRTNGKKKLWLDVETGAAVFSSTSDDAMPFLSPISDSNELAFDHKNWLATLLTALAHVERPITAETKDLSEIWTFPLSVIVNDTYADRIAKAIPDFDGWMRQATAWRTRGLTLPGEREPLSEQGRALQAFARHLAERKIQIATMNKLPERVREIEGNRYWDWYVVGGRWTGQFKLKPKAKGIVGKPGWGTNRAAPGYADQALKGEIDFEQQRNDAEVKARALWKMTRELTGGDAWESWEDTLGRYGLGEGKALDQAKLDICRREYHEQPAMLLLKASGKDVYSWQVDDDLALDEEIYVQRQRDAACVLYAFVRDSQWSQRGRMGWFGMASDEMSEAQWNRKFNQMLDDLPDDTLLTCIDCHV